MHKSHLLGCAVGIVAALVLLRLSGGSLGAYGVLLAALACPVMMLMMMKLMMSGQSTGRREPTASPKEPAPDDRPIR